MTKNFRLGTMMFLQFFVWGGWYVTVGNFMVAEGMGTITQCSYTISPLSAPTSPLLHGFVADRSFYASHSFVILHFLSGSYLLFTSFFTSQPMLFFLLLAIHMLCSMSAY